MSGSVFRPIHYIGNKARLLDDIESQVASLAGGPNRGVSDLFAGTGVVSRRLAERRPVFASDIQEYSRLLTLAQVAPYRFNPSEISQLMSVSRDLAEEVLSIGLRPLAEFEHTAMVDGDPRQFVGIIERGSIASWLEIGGHQRADQSPFELLLTSAGKALTDVPFATLARYYGGVYFGYEQAAQLDALAAAARGLPPESRATALAAVLSTASSLVASVGGHFAQPVRVTGKDGLPKPSALKSVVGSRGSSAFATFRRLLARWMELEPARHPVRFERADFREVLPLVPDSVGVVYADPPYTRDHYSRFYHVLETIALGDDPGLSTVKVRGSEVPSRGLYRLDRHQSPFSIVSEAPIALDELCRHLSQRDINLLLSYSPVPDTEKPRDRVMALDVLIGVVSASYRHVEVLVADSIGHSKFNAASLNAPVTYGAEVMIACRN